MNRPEEIKVPDHNAVWLAIAADNYYQADLAFWTLRAALGASEPSPAERAHLDHLRERRKAAYADLVIWTAACEGERMGAQR